VFGIRGAAQHWFGLSPRELNIKQAAFLAALTSEPESMGRRVRHAGGLDPDSAARVDVILRAMRRDGVIDDDQLASARESGLHFSQAALHAD
jgi:membrane peptidoglycan carboxypeptidase